MSISGARGIAVRSRWDRRGCVFRESRNLKRSMLKSEKLRAAVLRSRSSIVLCRWEAFGEANLSRSLGSQFVRPADLQAKM